MPKNVIDAAAGETEIRMSEIDLPALEGIRAMTWRPVIGYDDHSTVIKKKEIVHKRCTA